MNRKDGERKYINPSKPFLLIYESAEDGVRAEWFETETDLLECAREVTEYGDRIINAVEVEGIRNVLTQGHD